MKDYTIPKQLLENMASELGIAIEWRTEESTWSRVVGHKGWKKRRQMYMYLYRVREKLKNEKDTLA